MFYFQKILKKRKRLKLIYLSFTLIVILILLLLLRPILFKNWLNYPLELRSKIAFLKWKESFTYNCYGDCLRERQVLKEIFLDHYSHNFDIVVADLRADFLRSNNESYNLAIVKLLKDLDYNLNSQWINLIDSNISLESKSYLVSYFPQYFKDNYRLKNELKEIFLSELSRPEDKLLSLAMLGVYQEKETKDFLLEIVLGNYSTLLKKEALGNMSNLSADQISLLAENLINNYFDMTLNVSIVWLISDYYSQYPEIIISYLKQIYESEEADVFSRGFSALALNELVQANLKVPEINDLKWQKYYSHY